MTHYLYLITRLDGEQYVGVTNNPDRRLKEHYYGSGNFKLKGEKGLKIEILLTGEKGFIYAKEAEYINKYKASLNVHPGGCFPYNEPDRSGEKNGKAKFTERDVIDIRLSYSKGESQQSIAARYNRPAVTISKIVTGKTWPKSPGPIAKPAQGRRANSLTEEQKSQIKELHNKGLSGPEINELTGISLTSIYRYRRAI